MSKKFRAVVETGSCDISGKHWEEMANCGHWHKTREAAEQCGEKHRHYNRKTRECSALWAFPVIHNENQERV